MEILGFILALVLFGTGLALLVHRRAVRARQIAASQQPKQLLPTAIGDESKPARDPDARPYPIVLLHGLFGFDHLPVPLSRTEYFRGVLRRLREEHHEVMVVRVPLAASIEVRAAALVEGVRALPYKHVNLVAHSMGGLDARYAISKLGLADRVASLTTIGTPHHGTPIADRALRASAMLQAGLGRVGIDFSGLSDLTTAHMAEFNREVPDVEGVDYYSLVGRVRDAAHHLSPALGPTHRILTGLGLDSDGLVPAQSQRWGVVWGEVEADHWAQIGWGMRPTFDTPAFYSRLASGLRMSGH